MAHLLSALTFPLHGTRLIEASAGTGKTYTIAALYLRLILGHGGANGFVRPLMPPDILVMTYTNAAAQELRDRIRTRLTEAAAFLRGQNSGDDYLIALRGTFPAEQWPVLAARLDQAAQWMDEAAIHTIHSWCQRMLRQHAFDSGSLFDLTLETDHAPLWEEAACDYWRCHFYPLPAAQLNEMGNLIKCKTPQDLLKKIGPQGGSGDTAPPPPGQLLAERQQAIDAAKRIWAADFDSAVSLLRRAQADKTLKNSFYGAASLEKWLTSLTAWVRANGPLPDPETCAKLSTGGMRVALAKNRILPEHPAFAGFDRLLEQLSAQDIEHALLAHAAREIGSRFKAAKERRALMDFDDLLVRLNAALHRPDNAALAALLRRQFPVAMIDEFQDTDPVQYAILRKIYFSQPETGLLMIGDPKQAIYAFRGADIYTYLAARRDSAGGHYTLGTNYRATAGMVGAVNRIFEAGSIHSRGAFLFKSEIPFEPVAVQGRNDHLQVQDMTVDGLTLWQLPQNGPVSKTGAEGYLVQMADAAASEIVRLLNLGALQPPQAGFKRPGEPLRPLQPADIAILVRNGQEAGAIRKALAARRVRSVYLSDKDSVFATAEANALLYLLRACAEPEQERLVRTALATPVLALSFEHLERLTRDELAWERQVEAFRSYRQIWHTRGVLPMLRVLLRAFEVPSRLMSEAGGERRLTNLLHLSELAQSAAAHLEGEQALIRWLAQQIDQSVDASEEMVLRLESDEELIKVVTIHKSKGLEYPLVFLPFVCTCRKVTRRNTTLVRCHDEQGCLRLVRNPSDAELVQAEDERLAEDLRMLYVAVTRAQYACWLGVGVMGKASKGIEATVLHDCGLGYLLAGEQSITTLELDDKLTALKGDCDHIHIAPLPAATPAVHEPLANPPRLGPALTFTGAIPRDWRISSYSGMRVGTDTPDPLPASAVPAPQAADSAAEARLQETAAEPAGASPVEPAAGPDLLTIHRFPRGPEPGTFLHGLLEWAGNEGFGDLAQDTPRIHEKVTLLCRQRGWQAWAPMLTEWLRQLISTPLRLPQGSGAVSLADLDASSYQSELEFLLAVHTVSTREIDQAVSAAILPGATRPPLLPDTLNGMLKGFIDFVFRHAGRYYVLDYKSNHLGNDAHAYGPQAMAHSMLAHRYDLQYTLYTLALHRLLKARLPGYNYCRDVGGVIYLFLRGAAADGTGVYVDMPPGGLITRLDTLMRGEP